MSINDDLNGWKLLLRTGFGTIFDIGYGWDHEGLCLIAAAVNAPTKRAQELAWTRVQQFCRKKGAEQPAC